MQPIDRNFDAHVRRRSDELHAPPPKCTAQNNKAGPRHTGRTRARRLPRPLPLCSPPSPCAMRTIVLQAAWKSWREMRWLRVYLIICTAVAFVHQGGSLVSAMSTAGSGSWRIKHPRGVSRVDVTRYSDKLKHSANYHLMADSALDSIVRSRRPTKPALLIQFDPISPGVSSAMHSGYIWHVLIYLLNTTPHILRDTNAETSRPKIFSRRAFRSLNSAGSMHGLQRAVQ
ncbi:hypothetical protein A0H81_13234 [Grifola frondosa]|uniref:Uncharacterized protein n=1 Tax=Grifola frondosa TaxID=5627 RepID=A0A1C7LSK1_GRIFR|nr:hypothetical protein A0H81_13234 [Grifola frondosa]